jgi:polar amino acid transport system substrate-binding protein
MGMKVEIVNTPFDGLIPALNAGTVDAAISGMTITDSRKQQVNFCTPYYKSGLIVMVKKDNNNIKSIKDLEGKKIAVQIGTTGATQAHKVKGAKITEFNNNPEACLELKNGGADAVIGDLPVEQYYLKQGGDKDAKLVGDTLSAEDYGIAIAKKNTDLLEKMNKALAELKKNGEYDKLYKQWFGAAPKK